MDDDTVEGVVIDLCSRAFLLKSDGGQENYPGPGRPVLSEKRRSHEDGKDGG